MEKQQQEKRYDCYTRDMWALGGIFSQRLSEMHIIVGVRTCLHQASGSGWPDEHGSLSCRREFRRRQRVH